MNFCMVNLLGKYAIVPLSVWEKLSYVSFFVEYLVNIHIPYIERLGFIILCPSKGVVVFFLILCP